MGVGVDEGRVWKEGEETMTLASDGTKEGQGFCMFVSCFVFAREGGEEEDIRVVLGSIQEAGDAHSDRSAALANNSFRFSQSSKSS